MNFYFFSHKQISTHQDITHISSICDHNNVVNMVEY